MFRLTREIRFAIDPDPDAGVPGKAWNGYAGFPPLRGLGYFLTLQVTVAGELNPVSSCLVDIKEIDRTVRVQGVPIVEAYVRGGRFLAMGTLVQELFKRFQNLWSGLEELRLGLSPFLAASVVAGEFPMVRFSQKFEFSAAHRLHNPAISDQKNVELFGKCNNPHGHGHNYEIQVTLRGKPDASGQIMPVGKLEEIVSQEVIGRFDHKFLNREVPELAELNPTVENIARVAYGLLKPRIRQAGVELAGVTVWETPKTWCEYSE